MLPGQEGSSVLSLWSLRGYFHSLSDPLLPRFNYHGDQKLLALGTTLVSDGLRVPKCTNKNQDVLAVSAFAGQDDTANS